MKGRVAAVGGAVGSLRRDPPGVVVDYVLVRRRWVALKRPWLTTSFPLHQVVSLMRSAGRATAYAGWSHLIVTVRWALAARELVSLG